MFETGLRMQNTTLQQHAEVFSTPLLIAGYTTYLVEVLELIHSPLIHNLPTINT
jgi:hypothetical protein